MTDMSKYGPRVQADLAKEGYTVTGVWQANFFRCHENQYDGFFAMARYNGTHLMILVVYGGMIDDEPYFEIVPMQAQELEGYTQERAWTPGGEEIPARPGPDGYTIPNDEDFGDMPEEGDFTC